MYWVASFRLAGNQYTHYFPYTDQGENLALRWVDARRAELTNTPHPESSAEIEALNEQQALAHRPSGVKGISLDWSQPNQQGTCYYKAHLSRGKRGSATSVQKRFPCTPEGLEAAKVWLDEQRVLPATT